MAIDLARLSRNLYDNEVALSYLHNRGISNDGIFTFELGYETKSLSKMRERITFPIRDQYGALLSVQGRTLDKAVIPKYYHFTYDKSKSLYGLFQSVRMALRERALALVEGNLDVISGYLSGVPTVAKQGSTLKPYQAGLIARYVESVVIFADNDSAGEKSAQQDHKILSSLGVNCTIARFPQGVKDLNDYHCTYGSTKLRKFYEGFLP